MFMFFFSSVKKQSKKKNTYVGRTVGGGRPHVRKTFRLKNHAIRGGGLVGACGHGTSKSCICDTSIPYADLCRTCNGDGGAHNSVFSEDGLRGS